MSQIGILGSGSVGETLSEGLTDRPHTMTGGKAPGMTDATPDWLEMPEKAFQNWYRPAGNPSSPYLHRALLRALGPTATPLPANDTLRAKPLVVDLALPAERGRDAALPVA